MWTTCESCKHQEVNRHELPCSLCRPSGWEAGSFARSCRNCRYEGFGIDEDPCEKCEQSQWEKADGDKAVQ